MGFLQRVLGGRLEQVRASVAGPFAKPAVPELSAQELLAGLQSDAPVLLIDVREPWEWQSGHIDGARHIPMNTLPQHLESLKKEDDIVIYCHLGNRSWYATAYLMQQGFTNVASLAGGIDAWNRVKRAG